MAARAPREALEQMANVEKEGNLVHLDCEDFLEIREGTDRLVSEVMKAKEDHQVAKEMPASLEIMAIKDRQDLQDLLDKWDHLGVKEK